jgi:catechol 2,3-dioxygenase-like lactoylglutathione lyase family enzyme
VSLRINHVSINARDLTRSIDFYVELLDAEPIATPNFGIPVQWLALGRTQLHLFERDLVPTSHHHFGVTVNDVEPVYRAAERWNAFDDEAFHNRLVELPGDVVQLYVRDPSGNLVEIDHHGVDRLPDDLRARLKGLWDFNPHDDEQMSARLFVPE